MVGRERKVNKINDLRIHTYRVVYQERNFLTQMYHHKTRSSK